MADFTALKTAIQNAIKQNGNEEITGNILQDVLLAIVSTLGDGSINDLITALGSEATTRQQEDGTLQQNIDAEAQARQQAVSTEAQARQQAVSTEAQARQLGDSTLQGGINTAMQAINAINNAIANGCVYAGIATPSSTPASGKVFYLALTAGTYTNYGGLEVPQGINILKNNGSTWLLDSFLGIDDAPIQGSDNLVKSGGVLNSIIQNGPAFDLSAYNAQGGVLATYADLSAALTALNALPADFKKGGMSMKYVQTSDNKYVQYRLKADTFTTNEFYWVNVEKKVEEVENVVFATPPHNRLTEDDGWTNGAWNSDGTFNPNSTPYKSSDKLPLDGSGILILNQAPQLIAFWNGDNWLGRIDNRVPLATTIEIPYASATLVSLIIGVNVDVTTVSITGLKNYQEITLEQKINYNNIITEKGKYLNINGVAASNQASQNWGISSYIDIEDFTGVVFDKILKRTDISYFALYDGNKSFITSLIYDNVMDINKVNVDITSLCRENRNAKYFRVCCSYSAGVYGIINKEKYIPYDVNVFKQSNPRMLDLYPDYIGKYWNSNGELIDSADYLAKDINISYYAGKRLMIKAGYSTSPVGNCYVKLSDNTINHLSLYSVNVIAEPSVAEVIIPENATNLLLSWDISSIYRPWVMYDPAYNASNEMEEIANKFNYVYPSLIRKVYAEVEAFDYFGSTYGYIDNSGEVQGEGVDTHWKHTDFIEIEAGSHINANLLGQTGNTTQIAYYDSSKHFLSNVSVLQGTVSGIYVIPNNVKYVRLSTVNSPEYVAFLSGAYVGEEPTVPYIENEIKALSLKDESLKNIAYKYDVNHFVNYGQSLSQGDWENTVISTTQKYNSLMFKGTMRTWEYRDQAQKYASLVPAIETFFEYTEGETVIGAQRRGETECTGIGEKITEMIIADGFDINEYQFQMMMSAPGMGGTDIRELSDINGIYYKRLLEDVQNGKRLCNASGKSYVCMGVSWIQGEADCYIGSSYEYYYGMMKAMFENLNRDIKAITGQSEDVHFFLYQTWCNDFYGGYHYPYVALAQYDICREMNNCHMANPIYMMPLRYDMVHFTAEGSKWYGGYIGRAYKETFVDGKPWEGIYMKDVFVQGNNIYLTFNVPSAPLILDDTSSRRTFGKDKGFLIKEVNDTAQNSYLDIITSVEVTRPNCVKITCSQSPLGKKLTYGINGKGDGIADICGGCLRDSSNDVFSFPLTDGGTDVEHKLYNWCPIFETILR